MKCTHYKDVTEKLNTERKANAKELQEYSDSHSFLESSLYFFDKVRPDGEWDFKSQKEWDLKEDYSYYYGGQKLRFDDIGNIHYGYVGRVLYPEEVLLVAGGVVQIYTGTSSWKYLDTYYDEPRDREMIQYGSALWDYDEGD